MDPRHDQIRQMQIVYDNKIRYQKKVLTSKFMKETLKVLRQEYAFTPEMIREFKSKLEFQLLSEE